MPLSSVADAHPRVLTVPVLGKLAPKLRDYSALGLVTSWVARGQHVSYDSVFRCLMEHWSGAQTQEVAMSLLEGVSFLHDAGVVHRDLKEANFLVVQETGAKCRVVLLDFAGSLMSGTEEALKASQELLQSHFATYLGPCATAGKDDGKHTSATALTDEIGTRTKTAASKRAAILLDAAIGGSSTSEGGDNLPLNDPLNTLGTIGGGGTAFRRAKMRTDRAFNWSQDGWLQLWQHADRVAVGIIILCLAMREDVMRRCEHAKDARKISLDKRGGLVHVCTVFMTVSSASPDILSTEAGSLVHVCIVLMTMRGLNDLYDCTGTRQ